MRRQHPIHAKRLLARNLRRLRLERAWSQDDLAAEAKVRQALVSAMEVATANPTLGSLEKVATALRVEVADLLAVPAVKRAGAVLRAQRPPSRRGR
ncbi:helix-turn-helix domain-containing protein [Bradyrhizobium erythrophlei]|uniref:helix-turn-helix domain-containing protein n=1 Tax=Bradyrhizobium erythrophlei TaxID=1437360 RepID=UPI0035EF6CAA